MSTDISFEASLQHALDDDDPFRILIGYDYVVSDTKEIGVRLLIEDRHRNRHGVLHGGIPPLLLAVAGALAVYKADGKVEHALNVAMNINFIRSVCEGSLIAHGHVERVGKTLAHINMHLTVGIDDEKLLATAQAVYRLVRSPHSE